MVQDVLNAPQVVVGRSFNVMEQGQFVLSDWLITRDVTHAQCIQDVYNKALYLRTAVGRPVNIISGGEYTLGEITAAEAGARASGISNRLFWR
ncbi:MAG: hypothetical protein M3040_11190 [Bacteroidota bacterium]|nr:hypothetical protein [Bacteroidota bacterium]